MRKRFQSLLMIIAIAMMFASAFAVLDGGLYAEAKTKKYYLPKSSKTVYYDEDRTTSSLQNAKYDKYGNLRSGMILEMIPMQFKAKYRNKKGTLERVSISDGDPVGKKYYNKKGYLTKIKFGKQVYKVSRNKKGLIKKITIDGKTYYRIKSIKYHKNGFVSKVVYGNGNVNRYNTAGLMTSATVKTEGEGKYTYKYTKKNGKVVKVIVRCNGELYSKTTVKYGKKSTKDIWKYSCAMSYAGCPTNAYELYAKSTLSGINY